MFEISGNDISSLGDADLRCLVARLVTAEFRAKGYPLSSVTAGGDQDAADGGLDVRVECRTGITDPDFVPRRLTGFQVKKPNMPPSAIRDEMRPKGVLRDAIRELADASGAYVIVSAQGSVVDTALAARRKAMREALSDLPNAARLHIDFYDRDRIATWVNQHPGIAAWDTPLRNFGAHTVILICLTGDEGRPAAEKVCRHICSALDAYQVSPHNLSYIFKALLETQPFVTLDVFLLFPSPHGIHHRFDMNFTMGPPLESVDPAILQKWVSCDPRTRYPVARKVPQHVPQEKQRGTKRNLSALLIDAGQRARQAAVPW